MADYLEKNRERQRRLNTIRTAQGFKRVSVWLTPDAWAIIQDALKNGKTIEAAINETITANAKQKKSNVRDNAKQKSANVRDNALSDLIKRRDAGETYDALRPDFCAWIIEQRDAGKKLEELADILNRAGYASRKNSTWNFKMVEMIFARCAGKRK